MEQNIIEKEDVIKELVKINESEERNALKKKNMLQRLEDLEKQNDEKDAIIKVLCERVEKLELKLQDKENEPEAIEKTVNTIPCEYCDFCAKNERGLKLHINAKHEITKVQLSVFCKATEKYLSSDRDMYRKELENEIDVLEDVIDMDIDLSKVYDYVGKFLPMKIVLRSRIPVQWETCETFRKQIWERINKRIVKGKSLKRKKKNEQLFFHCCI